MQTLRNNILYNINSLCRYYLPSYYTQYIPNDDLLSNILYGIPLDKKMVTILPNESNLVITVDYSTETNLPPENIKCYDLLRKYMLMYKNNFIHETTVNNIGFSQRSLEDWILNDTYFCSSLELHNISVYPHSIKILKNIEHVLKRTNFTNIQINFIQPKKIINKTNCDCFIVTLEKTPEVITSYNVKITSGDMYMFETDYVINKT